jgi:RNA polymerase sigma factor (sigma-70 family)
MNRYRNPALKILRDQQIRFAPIDVRLKQVDRAEQLLAHLDATKSFTYPELCEKITSYRSETYPDLVVTGDEAVHDLRCFVEDLSESVAIPIEQAGEPVWSVADVGRRYHVSEKTVNRWRDKGLVSRRFKVGDKTRLGFLRSSVERFVQQNPETVERGAKFTQVTDAERETMIRRARRLARAGGCPTEINRRLARKFGRSPETVRYTLKNFDREHPEVAVFPNSTDPLTVEQKKELYKAYRRGEDPDALSETWKRTRASIYRIVAEVRARMLTEQPVDFMDSPEFHRSNSDAKILEAPRPELKEPATPKIPPGLPPYLASLYSIPLLSREQEVYYFRKMNYLRYKAAQLQKKIDPARPRAKDMDELEKLLEQAGEIKNFLIRSNLRLVVSIAKRHMKPNTSFFEMVSDGNMSLIRAIEKFDYTKGFKFSTYASWAVMKNFARSIPAEHTQLERFRTGHEEIFQNSSDYRLETSQDEIVNHRQHAAIMGILEQLEPREKDIIVQRYGLSEGAGPLTLEQVGHRFGVTKERIRQLEARALKKMRKIAQEENLEIPGV